MGSHGGITHSVSSAKPLRVGLCATNHHTGSLEPRVPQLPPAGHSPRTDMAVSMDKGLRRGSLTRSGLSTGLFLTSHPCSVDDFPHSKVLKGGSTGYPDIRLNTTFL